MKIVVPTFYTAFLFLMASCIGLAGPKVVPHEKEPIVKVWDNKFEIVQEFEDPKQIGIVQGIFLRAKRVGDTSTHLKTSTHKIDFSDRWIIDLNSGEIAVLSKRVVTVFQILDKDLIALRKLIKQE